MTAMLSASWADGLPAVAVSYAADAPRPWRWVRDEIRVRPDGIRRDDLRRVAGAARHRWYAVPAAPRLT